MGLIWSFRTVDFSKLIFFLSSFLPLPLPSLIPLPPCLSFDLEIKPRVFLDFKDCKSRRVIFEWRMDSLQDADHFSEDECIVCISHIGRSLLGPRIEFKILRYTQVITCSIAFNRVVVLWVCDLFGHFLDKSKDEDLPDYCRMYSVLDFICFWRRNGRCFLVLFCVSWAPTLRACLCCCESQATAVLFTSVFHTSCAACTAVHRYSINICWVNELTFLKGHSCKRGSSLKVYNLENINYVEMEYAMGFKSIEGKQNRIFSGCARHRIVFSLVVEEERSS